MSARARAASVGEEARAEMVHQMELHRREAERAAIEQTEAAAPPLTPTLTLTLTLTLALSLALTLTLTLALALALTLTLTLALTLTLTLNLTRRRPRRWRVGCTRPAVRSSRWG